MRTTLTLEEDVAAKLKAEVRSSGKSFKQVVNETLRLGLTRRRAEGARARFQVEPRALGGLRPGVSLDNVAALLEQVEGADHR